MSGFYFGSPGIIISFGMNKGKAYTITYNCPNGDLVALVRGTADEKSFLQNFKHFLEKIAVDDPEYFLQIRKHLTNDPSAREILETVYKEKSLK